MSRLIILAALIVLGCAAAIPDRFSVFGARTWGESEGFIERGGGEDYRAATLSENTGWMAGAGFEWDIGATSPPEAYVLPSYIEVPFPVAVPVDPDTPTIPSNPPAPAPAPDSTDDHLAKLWPQLVGLLLALVATATAWLKRAAIQEYVRERRAGDD